MGRASESGAWRILVLSLGLLSILSSAACGGNSPSGACGGRSRGCVDLLDFYSTPVTVAVTGGGSAAVPAPTSASGSISPGASTINVASALGAQSTFTATVGGASKSATCTVTSQAWLDVAPRVIVQQALAGGDLTCSNW